MYPTIVKTSFFDNPKEIIDFSKQINWYKPGDRDNWPGLRSDNLFNINLKLHDYIVEKIVRLYFNGHKTSIGYTKIQFHKINYEDWLNHNRKNTRVHKDFTELAGIIYLNQNTNNLNTGTSLYDNDGEPILQISNNFNTLACYDGNHYHGLTGLDKNERLTIVIFLDKIKEIKAWL